MKEQHICEYTPNSYKIVKSPINGWGIASKEVGSGFGYTLVVYKIKNCPFCGDKLNKE